MSYQARDPRFWLLAAALALVLVALSAPKLTREHAVFDLVAIVDITGSMNTRDMMADGVAQSRLAAARTALQGLLASLPCQSRFGLGVFTERRAFLLIDPVEVCENYAALDGAIGALDWRMAWEGDSYVAKGIYSGLEIAQALNAALVFLTDGHEAPPLPRSGMPEFTGKPGEVSGLIVGVGGKGKSPIPKFNEDGEETGSWGALDVPHDNRVGAPPENAATLEGYHPKWAPFGSAAPVGEEHLSSVRTDHLMAVAAKTGLSYVELARVPALLGPVKSHVRPRLIAVVSDIRAYPAAAALVLLALLFGLIPAIDRNTNRTRAPANSPGHSVTNERIPQMTRAAVLLPAFVFLAAFGPQALAHGPTPRKVEERVAISASPDTVWSAIKDFAGLASWHPGVTKSEGDGGNSVGATRSVTLKSGGALVDGLDEYNDAAMSYGYRLQKENLEALPVSFYSALLSVKASGSGSEVEWIGRFYRGDTGNFPPDNLNDEAATRAMTAFFREGLDGLKAKLEAKP